MGRRVLRRVLRRGSKKGLSRRHLEGRSTPFREYDPVGVCPTMGSCKGEGALRNGCPGALFLNESSCFGDSGARHHEWDNTQGLRLP